MRLRESTGWAVLVLLSTVGCGQTSAPSDTGSGAHSGNGDVGDAPVTGLAFAQSGSRLVALGYSSNEAKLFQTFHDSQLGFDCDFVLDAAGAQQRCVPSDRVDVVYTDPGCREPAVWIDQWAPREQLAVGHAVSGDKLAVDATCPGDAPLHREAFRIAEQLSEESTIGAPSLPFYQMRDERCQSATPRAKVTPPAYRLVPLPEVELVAGTQVSLELADGLRLRRLIAEDGAQLSLGATSGDGKACEFQRDGECVPTPIARTSPAPALFAVALNADCTELAFELPYASTCGPAKFGVDDDGVRPPRVWSMESVSHYFRREIIQPVTDPLRVICHPRTADEVSWVAAPLRDLTGTLPTASQLRRGAGPLHVDWFSVGNIDVLPARAQFVDDAGRACEVVPADDGAHRCVFFDASGNLTADLATFPQVVRGPL
jgi:hypothetical protein